MKKLPEDIRELEGKIFRLKEREESYRKSVGSSEYSGAVATGLRIAIELLSAVLVGTAIGFVFDRAAGTRPVFLTVFLLFGGAAGILNVYRLSKTEEKRKNNKE